MVCESWDRLQTGGNQAAERVRAGRKVSKGYCECKWFAIRFCTATSTPCPGTVRPGRRGRSISRGHAEPSHFPGFIMFHSPDAPSRRRVFAPARAPIAIALALALSMPAAADALLDADAQLLEQVVVTAAGFEQKIVDAPASISVVTRAELEKRPYMTLVDAVRDLEGIDVGETSDKTGQKTISMRGMGSDYTLILIDGRRQNNHGDIYPNSFGGNQFNHIPPLDTIERIEVIRGPASTLYGADALGGVINIITKRVSDHWSGSVTAGHSFQQEKTFGEDTTYDFAAQGPLIPGVLGLAVRGARYERDASQPEYEEVIDPDG